MPNFVAIDLQSFVTTNGIN